MEMSIEEIIEIKHKYLDDIESTFEMESLFDSFISVMEKYQKISDAIKFADDNELGYEYIGEKVYEVFVYDR